MIGREYIKSFRFYSHVWGIVVFKVCDIRLCNEAEALKVHSTGDNAKYAVFAAAAALASS